MQPSGDANERIVNYLVDAYGMNPERAATVAVGGNPAQVAERLAAYQAAGASTSWSFPSATTCSPSTT